ncbi:MAG: hypothetical protein CME62_02715 [Halobacteriovoraceae bacterium]|nr:hypothetical protein [Halobacteriovoraceae bacterium]
MNKLLMILMMLFMALANASDLDVKVSPKEPVYNDAFEVEFEISTDKDINEEPSISFEPIGVEVLSKGDPSVSTRTTFINGKMSFERKLSIKYSMVAPSSGYAFLRKIRVNFAGEELKHKNINIRVLQNARRPLDMFVRAEVDKEQFYAGESILTRYYLYAAEEYPVSSFDVLKFPKLGKFMKRYHQEKMIPERVSFQGRTYIRRVIYTAQLFAPDAGTYFIDPLSLNVVYSDRSSSSTRYGFGIAFGRTKKRSVRSKQIKLEILPVPAANMPKNFSGLVGKHNFKLVLNKQKFLANEPIELQFQVEGEGALELYDPPKIIQATNIEEFETSSDLKINQDFTAIKTFEYTYLGRGDVSIPQKELSFVYFDPETGEFREELIDFGPLEVVGFGQSPTPITKNEVSPKDESTAPIVSDLQQKPSRVFAPLYKGINSFVFYSKHLLILIGTLLILFLTYLAIKQFQSLRNRNMNLFETIYKRGLDYSLFYQVVQKLGSGDNMQKVIEESQLPKDSKQYLISLVHLFNEDYKGRKDKRRIEIQKKHFQAVEKLLKKKTYESDYQLSSI